MSVKVLINYFKEELELLRSPANAIRMEAYMKDLFKFYGVNAPTRKELISRIWQTEKATIKKDIRPLVKALWSLEEREYQMIALELLKRCHRSFTAEDLPFIEQLITTKSWWDTVDFLAATMICHILSNSKDLATETAYRYMNSDNMWLQRTALIFQLKYKEDTDYELMFDLISRTKGSKEFFINKASGWALRQYSKFNAEVVEDYINRNRGWLVGLTIREGSKYL